MKCIHCGETVPSLLCPKCGIETLEKSLFCCWCGSPMKVRPAAEEEIDFSERVLCSDGSCVGVINEKGVCNVCGRPSTGEQPA